MHKNSQLVRRLFNQANEGDVSLYDELCWENVQLLGPGSNQITNGLAALKQMDQGYYRAYPGTKFELEEVIANRNRVMVRWKAKGLYQEGYKGIQPKKREFSISGISIYLIRSGKIQKIETFWDRLGMLEQIGDVQVRPDPVQFNDYTDLLKNLGMEKHLQQASLLTSRERQCLDLLLQGQTAKQTAFHLALSPRTVEFYMNNIKRKLKCSNKGELFSTAEVLRKLELL